MYEKWICQYISKPDFFAFLSKHYFTIGLANGYVGYVPPAKDIDLGGYETWRCRTSCLEKNAEEKIRAELLRLIIKTR